MDNIDRQLKGALSEKEKHELFLSNLERLHDEKTVNDSSYNSLKTEYSNQLKQSTSRIEMLKQELNKDLRAKSKRLEVYKQDLANIEARLKVGQISAKDFFQQSRAPEQNISRLEDEVSRLNLLINSQHSSEILVTQNTGFGSLFGFVRKPENKPAILETIEQDETAPPPPPQQAETVDQPAAHRDTTSITSLSILPDKVLPGSHVGVVAIIDNFGTEELIHRAEMSINNKIESIIEVKLAAGQSEEITFMTVAGNPGEYFISVDGASGILAVLPPPQQ